MHRSIFALGALILTGCASGPSGPFAGLAAPDAAPAAPAAQLPYPAVHDLPPPRGTTPLTTEEQQKLERDLAATRAKQEKLR
jgi:hypothetical protein